MPQRSLAATLALWIGGLAALAAVLGPLTAQLGLLPPLGGFQLFMLGVAPGALIALVFGLVGLFRTRSASGLAGRGRAWLGLALGASLIGVAVVSAGSGGGVPAIHDITTDIGDPPVFAEALAADGRVNGIGYPDGGADVPKLQQQAYPDLKPIEIQAGVDEVWRRAEQAVESLGWTSTLSDQTTGTIQATDVSALFKFVDDVSIRVRSVDAERTVVDVRSNSRVGRSDMGANAARIRAFRDALLAGS